MATFPTYVGEDILLKATSVDINSAATDVAEFTIPYSKYIVRRVTITNASTSLGASAATLGVFTAATGGGTTIVTDATITALSAASKFTDMTIALNADSTTSSSIFVRNGTAHGGAATVDVYIELQRL